MKHWKGNFYLKSSNQLLVSHPSEIYLKIVEQYELLLEFWTFPPLFYYFPFFFPFSFCLFGLFFCCFFFLVDEGMSLPTNLIKKWESKGFRNADLHCKTRTLSCRVPSGCLVSVFILFSFLYLFCFFHSLSYTFDQRRSESIKLIWIKILPRPAFCIDVQLSIVFTQIFVFDEQQKEL